VRDEFVAVTERNGIVDCRHYASAVLVDDTGSIVWSLGDPERIVFERSTTKPFRALAVLRGGCLSAFRLTEGDIALVAGSHSGTIDHVGHAAELLAKIGASVDEVQCGIRLPLGEDGLRQLATAGQPLNALHCDCSGEHIGILALCRRLDYSTRDYLAANHPVQTILSASLAEFGEARAVGCTVDRCGMPTAAVSLATVARRMGKLVLTREHDEHVDLLLRAIIRHPMVYTGRGRIIGELIARSSGEIFGKCGAEGLYAVVWPGGLALALKIADGNPRAAVPVLYRAAEAAGVGVPNLDDCVNTGVFSVVRPVTQKDE